MRFPVEASRAIMEFANRFSPNRFPPQKSKDADPVGIYTTPLFSSKLIPAHALAPPICSYAFFGHVEYPYSPGFGIV